MPDSIFSAATEDETAALAASLAAKARPGDVILLAGPLGAGKTVFARGFIRALAGDPTLEIPSPSFTLVQIYETTAAKIWHFDLWRLDGPGGLAELGCDDARRDVVLVEWPDRLAALTPPDALRVVLQVAGEGRRVAELQGWAGRLAGLPGAPA